MFASLFQPTVSPDDNQASSAEGVPGNQLLELAYSFSPSIEETSKNTLVLDITGLAWRFISYQALADTIAEQAINAGLSVYVAVSYDADTAIHIARNKVGVECIPPGVESEHLAPLPLKIMDPSLAGIDDDAAQEILEILSLWGLKTFGNFAALPDRGVAERLGQNGVRLQRLAKGINHRHIVARTIKPEFEYSIELEHHIKEIEPLSFILSRQLHQLCASLESLALATNQIRLQLTLDGKEEPLRTINLPYPMRDPKTFLKLLLLNIEIDLPEAPIMALSVGCTPVKPRALQNGLFQPLAPQPDKLEITLARIRNLVGAGNLGFADLLNTHRPDAFAIRPFTITTNRKKKQTTRQTFRLGLRRFRPLLAAEVRLVNEQPTHVTVRDAKRLNGAVMRLAGPWRTTGDWWRNDQWAQDEWDVLLRDSARKETLCRLIRELRNGRWYVEGIYD
jgi:protein ImuB